MNPVERSRDITLRPKRQLTLPPEICDLLGLQVGDRLELSVTDDALVVKPKKTIALKALAEIQRVFQESGVTEDELKEEGVRIRERLSGTRYGET